MKPVSKSWIQPLLLAINSSADDGSFFSKTIVAHGRHMATWVNGIQVTDYADTRSEGADVLKEAQLNAGPISLQAHDPTTTWTFAISGLQCCRSSDCGNRGQYVS